MHGVKDIAVAGSASRNTKQRNMMMWIWHRCHCLIPSKMMMYFEELKNLDVTNLTPIDALNTTVSVAEQVKKQVVVYESRHTCIRSDNN